MESSIGKELLEGISDIHIDTSHKVERVLEYYVGGESDRSPFGGRGKQTEALNRWLNDSKGEGNKALVATAGRGKSALLANWAVNIARGREDIHVVYFPITARYNTNLESVVFSALAGRIARLYEEEIRTVKALDAQQARALFVTYLDREPPDGKNILVVLDGLDEAAGWEIGADVFPAHHPEYLSVLVAARPLAGDRDGRAWLSRLGWSDAGKDTVMDLDLLNEEGVKDVLHKMGDPLDQLSVNYDITKKLHELSEGDPLLLRLYVESLLEEDDVARITPEELKGLSPGLQGYMEKWFEDQKNMWAAQYKHKKDPDEYIENDRRVRGFFDILAFAKGPLAREDVYKIGNGIFKDKHEILIVTEYTKRFVVGDGVESGYVFSHPKIGYYFEDQLDEQERAEYRQLFVDYGDHIFQQLRDKAIEPGEAPVYVVQNYSVHLDEVGAERQKYYDLMCKEWMKAWEWLEGTPTGFLSDVRKAWDRAIEEGPDGIAKQIMALYFITSINSFYSQVFPKLLISCVQRRIINIQLGLYFLENMQNDLEMIKAIFELFSLIPNTQKRKWRDISYGIWLEKLSEKEKAETLPSMLPILDNTYYGQIIEYISNLKIEEERYELSSYLFRYLEESQKKIVLSEVLDILGSSIRRERKISIAIHFLDYFNNKNRDEQISEVKNYLLKSKKMSIQILNRLKQSLSKKEISVLVFDFLQRRIKSREFWIREIQEIPDGSLTENDAELLIILCRESNQIENLLFSLFLTKFLPSPRRKALIVNISKMIHKVGIGKFPEYFKTLVDICLIINKEHNDLSNFYVKIERLLTEIDYVYLYRIIELLKLVTTNDLRYLLEDVLEIMIHVYIKQSDLYEIKDFVDVSIDLLNEKQIRNLWRSFNIIGDYSAYFQINLSLLNYIPENNKEKIVDHLLINSNQIKNEEEKVSNVLNLIPYLSGNKKHVAIRKILDEIYKLKEYNLFNKFFLKIIPLVKENVYREYRKKILKTIQEQESLHIKIKILLSCYRNFPLNEKEGILIQIIEILDKSDDSWFRSENSFLLLEEIDNGHKEKFGEKIKMLSLIREDDIKDGHLFSMANIFQFPLLPIAERKNRLDNVAYTTGKIEHAVIQAAAINKISPHLSLSELRKISTEKLRIEWSTPDGMQLNIQDQKKCLAVYDDEILNEISNHIMNLPDDFQKARSIIIVFPFINIEHQIDLVTEFERTYLLLFSNNIFPYKVGLSQLIPEEFQKVWNKMCSLINLNEEKELSRLFKSLSKNTRASLEYSLSVLSPILSEKLAQKDVEEVIKISSCIRDLFP